MIHNDGHHNSTAADKMANNCFNNTELWIVCCEGNFLHRHVLKFFEMQLLFAHTAPEEDIIPLMQNCWQCEILFNIIYCQSC